MIAKRILCTFMFTINGACFCEFWHSVLLFREGRGHHNLGGSSSKPGVAVVYNQQLALVLCSWYWKWFSIKNTTLVSQTRPATASLLHAAVHLETADFSLTLDLIECTVVLLSTKWARFAESAMQAWQKLSPQQLVIVSLLPTRLHFLQSKSSGTESTNSHWWPLQDAISKMVLFVKGNSHNDIHWPC